MATLTPEQVTIDDGLSPTGTAASAGGDEAPTGSGRLLYVANGGASSVDVTVATPLTVSGLAIADVSATVDAGAVWLLPLAREVFRDPSSGRAAITYSDTTSVTVAVLDLP